MSDDDASCVIVSDGECRVTLHAPDRLWEHGLEHRVDLRAGPLQGTMIANAFANPYRRFLVDLEKLYQTLSGEVRLGPSYENLDLTFKGDGKGHIEAAVTAFLDHARSIKLEFRIFLDQTQLRRIIDQIERVFAAP